MTEAMVFPEVFGFKYVKSSVCNYKKVWKDASPEIIAEFIAYGHTAQGLWSKLSARVK
ncbi:hypothetical protein GALMADRAFT_23433, partial [Galerina marginata CBS 339.88]